MELEKFAGIRHIFHQQPELSENEINTAILIERNLKSFFPILIHTNIGGYGIIAEYVFSEKGPVLLFRADTDAVAVTETLPLDYVSQNPGISHKCGHDGHTTILLAFADLLHRFPLKQGRILLLFQPAEETGKGAAQVLNDTFFKDLKIDHVFALHNLPGYPLSTVVCRQGSFTCSVISCTISVTGKTSHAAEPDKAISPTPVLLKLLHKAEKWDVNIPDSKDYFRSSLIELHIGEEAYGVTAGAGLIRFTFRAATEKKLHQHIQKLEKFIKNISLIHPRLEIAIKWQEAFIANENDLSSVNLIKQAAATNQLTYQETPYPFAWGEDFGVFTQQYPGAMFGLGAGIDTPPLHSPEYDFPDKIIEDGARMFYEIAKTSTY